MNFLGIAAGILDIVEHALRNPMDKAAVQIAIDGIAAARKIYVMPEIKQLQEDIGAYVATLPPPQKPEPVPDDHLAPELPPGVDPGLGHGEGSLMRGE